VTTARIRVDHAGPLTTVQDRGRFGYQRYGVTEGGPMDRTAFAIGQAALGQASGSTSIEVGLGGVSLRCVAGPVVVAICGGNFSLSVDGRPRHSWSVARLAQGMELAIGPGRWGSWCYIAVAGTIRWPVWLGSQSTYPALPFTGRPLIQDDEIVIETPGTSPEPERELTIPVFCQPRNVVDLVIGPQERFFSAETLQRLFEETWFLSAAMDRMGVRLEGPKLPIAAPLDMLSEGLLRGSVQIPGSGDPLVLMADHQTTGGYPRIATLISADQDAFAQLRPRQPVRFRAVTVEHAVARARTRRKAVHDYLATLLRTVRAEPGNRSA
jgi:allophanate hydrolase